MGWPATYRKHFCPPSGFKTLFQWRPREVAGCSTKRTRLTAPLVLLFVAHCQLHTLRLADWFFPPGYLWVTCFLSANGLEGRGARCGREGEPLQNITGYSRSAMWKRSQVDWSARDKRAPRAAAPIRRRSRSSERGSGWPLPSLPVHLCSTNAFHLTPLG